MTLNKITDTGESDAVVGDCNPAKIQARYLNEDRCGGLSAGSASDSNRGDTPKGGSMEED